MSAGLNLRHSAETMGKRVGHYWLREFQGVLAPIGFRHDYNFQPHDQPRHVASSIDAVQHSDNQVLLTPQVNTSLTKA